MIKSDLKIVLRNLLKNRLFVLINVFGLGIALASCIVAFLNWDYNAKFDSYHIHADKLYRVNFIRHSNGRPIKNGICPVPLGHHIRDAISQVEEVLRFMPLDGNFKVGDDIFRTSLAAVDPAFFEHFTFEIIAGDRSQLQDKRTLFISNELALKFFPDVYSAIGQTIRYIKERKQLDFKVGAVFRKPPKNTSFYPQAYFNYNNVEELTGNPETDWKSFNTTFVRIEDAAVVPLVEQQLQEYVAIQNEAKKDYKVAEFYLDPFEGMAVRAEREDIWNHRLAQSLPVAAAIAPGIMALLILLIACFNFTNTSIAIANQRIKEIGVRKVLGSSRKQLIVQFLGENILLCFFALVTALLLAAFLVPGYSAMWPFLEIKLDLLENLDLLAFLAALLLFTGLLAGSYPAFYVSRFQANTILRGKIKFSGTNAWSRTLLTLQFSISLIAILSAFVFAQNARYQQQYDMGFDMESVLYAYVKDGQGYETLRNELKGYANIQEIAGSKHSVTASWYTDPIRFKSSELDVNILDIGTGYLSTIGATVVKGRDFVDGSRHDVQHSVIINEELARTFGWDDPIDQRIVLRDTVELFVVGVVRDIYVEGGLWNPLEPMLMRYVLPEEYKYLTARSKVADLVAVKSIMDEKWKLVFPNELSTVNFMIEQKANAALVNQNIKVLFVYLGIVAILLSGIGLFSLVSLNMNKRMKEIGVRKILGAGLGHLSFRLSREFLIILTIAAATGSLAGYFLTNLLLSNIWAYYLPSQPAVIVISILILFIVGGLTIGVRILKVLSHLPARFLQNE